MREVVTSTSSDRCVVTKAGKQQLGEGDEEIEIGIQ
jgi:hypothetical protein